MNPAMAQALAEKFGLSDEDGMDPAVKLASQISDPLMAALFSSMLQQRSANLNTAEEESDEGRLRLERDLTRAKKVIQKLRQEVVSANTMTSYIARVFGACPACWGLNQFCPHCQGQGKPGAYQPAETELLAWVEPALAKLGRIIVKNE